jgi:hypothetical protein
VVARQKALDVDQDLDFQRKDWVFERIGWGAMLLVVLASALGLLGRGPLSKVEARASDGSLRVQYGRLEHYTTPTHFTVLLPRAAATDTTVALWVSNEYLGGIRLDRVLPEPLRETSQANGTVFDLPVVGDSARVSFQFEHARVGSRPIEIGVPGHETLRLPQFVFP